MRMIYVIGLKPDGYRVPARALYKSFQTRRQTL